MHLIRKGYFAMGDHTEQNSNALPVRHIKMGSFYMDETPVTVADFKEYIAAGGEIPAFWSNVLFQKENIPVTGVSWNQAADFCNWRSKVEGLEPAYILKEEKNEWGHPVWELNNKSNGYRLPTEAEYEFAARGGLTENDYPWGDEFEKTFANYDNERGNALGNWILLADVKTQKANNFGLFGMSGNIWHWCNDWYSYGYDEKEKGKNPMGPVDGKVKVLRGGSWGSTSEEQLKVSNRSFSSIGNYNYDIGFRCVRPVKVAIIKTLKQKNISLNAPYKFYQSPQGTNTQKNDWYQTEDFHAKLRNYISENFSNCIYLNEKVDQQPKLNSTQMADLIIRTSKKYDINPIFTTAVMVAETGFASVSLSRWFNNPVAYNWEMPSMDGKSVIYTSNNYINNGSYYDLDNCLNDFNRKLRLPEIRSGAYSDLFDFHKVLLGEEKFYWIQNISNVYRDLGGINIEEDIPSNNVGKLIYTDWTVSEEYIEEIFPDDENSEEENVELALEEDNKIVDNVEVNKVNNIVKEEIAERALPVSKSEVERDGASLNPVRKTESKKKAFYLILKEDLESNEAANIAGNLRNNGFPTAGVVQLNGKTAVAIAQFKKESKAKNAQTSLSEIYGTIKLVALDE